MKVKDRKKILVLGEKYSDNLGDGVICKCFTELLKRKCPEFEVICDDMSIREDYMSPVKTHYGFLDRIKLFLRHIILDNKLAKIIEKKHFPNEYLYLLWRWHFNDKIALKHKYKGEKYAAIVFAGGELLKDDFVYKIENIVNYFNHTPVFFNACGVNYLNDALVTKKLKKILKKKNVRRVTTRSISTVDSLFDKTTYKIVPDSAIATKDVFGIKPSRKWQLGLGIMAIWDNEEEKSGLYGFWEKTIEEVKKRGLSFKLFTNGDKSDYEFALDLCKHCGLDDSMLLEKPTSPEKLVEEICCFNSIYTFRMHSAIIAYSYKIPFVCFSWDRKINDFLNMTDLKKANLNWKTCKPSSALDTLLDVSFNEARYLELRDVIDAELETVTKLISKEK